MSDETPPGDARGRKSALGADLIIPVMAFAFAIYFFVSVSGLAWEARANGTVIGAALVAFVVFQVFRTLREVRAGRADLSLGEFGIRSPEQMKRIWIVVLLAAFVAAVPYTGTTLGLFLVMLASMWILGVRSPKTLLGASAGVAIVGYVLFIALLKTQFPEGPVEWLGARVFGVR